MGTGTEMGPSCELVTAVDEAFETTACACNPLLSGVIDYCDDCFLDLL